MNKIYTQNKDLRKLIDTNLKPVVLTRSISNHKKVFYIYLVLFVTSLSLSFLLLSNNVNAQNYYSLQFSDTSTYDNTCGTVKPSQWSVKNDSCILYTPYFRNESPGCTNVVYDFLINQSGNGDVDDHVYIQYQLDGGPWITDTLLFASNYAAVHNLTGTINICYGVVIRIRLIMVTNSNSEFWAIKNGDGTLTGTFVTYTSYPKPLILPIELGSYNIKCTENGSVVYWTTLSEINNEYFTVEKSNDMRSWNILSVVSGEINSSSIQYYSVEERDFNKVPGNYYRLKQTDIDGRSKYYDILTRTCKSAPATLQFVGINSNGLNIDISFNSYASENVTIEVFDISGKVMINENIVPVEGTNILTVQTPGFKSGIYMVSILQNDNRVSKKIMVK